MEKRNPLLYVILTVCIVNLAISLFILMKPQSRIPTESSSLSDNALPKALQNENTRNTLFEDFRFAYNSNDIEKLWNMLDPMVRARSSKNGLNQQLKKLKEFCGEITDGAYSHYETIANTQGIKQFKLYYEVSLENSKGNLYISVGQQGNEPYRLFGWFLNKQV